MNQLQPDRVFGGEINPQHLDYFSLPVYEHFNGKPFHIFKIVQQWDIPRILTDCKSSVIRSRQSFDPSLPERQRERVVAVLLQSDDAFCFIESSWLLCYASTPEIARKKALQLMKRYAQPVKKEKPRFHVLSLRSDTLEIQAVEVAKPFNSSWAKKNCNCTMEPMRRNLNAI